MAKSLDRPKIFAGGRRSSDDFRAEAEAEEEQPDHFG
jgi:hypothetical protein